MSSAALNNALCEAQKCVDAMQKTGLANGVAFVPTEDMIREARRCLLMSGLVLRRAGVSVEMMGYYTKMAGRGAEKVAVEQAVFRVEITYVLVHVDTGDSREWKRHQVALPEAFQPLDKAIAAASTFDFGYAIRDLLLIPRVAKGEEVDLRADIGIVEPEGISEKLGVIEEWKEELRKNAPTFFESLSLPSEARSEEQVEANYKTLKDAIERCRAIKQASLFLKKLGDEHEVCSRLGIPLLKEWGSLSGAELKVVCEKIAREWSV